MAQPKEAPHNGITSKEILTLNSSRVLKQWKAPPVRKQTQVKELPIKQYTDEQNY